MKQKLAVFLIVLLILSSCSSVAWAIPAATGQVSTAEDPLPGYVLQGPAPADLTVLVNIAIPLRNTDQLSSMAKQVSDPTSPLYRHFLTPQQIEQQFLPKAECEAMLSYLQGIGLTVVMNSLDAIIVVQATVGQVKQLLNADVNIYSNGTQSYYMTNGSPKLNGAHVLASNATALFFQPQLASLSSTQQAANTTYTISAFSAKDLQEVYNATSLYEQGYQGENQTIGILDFYGSPTIREDLELFNTQFGFPTSTLNIIPIGPYNPNLGAYTGWDMEVALDVESAHAMAPKAAIDLYVGAGTTTLASALARIISLNRVTTLSMSFGWHEYSWLTYGAENFIFNLFLPDQFFMIGTLQGITFLGSSGDAGGSGYSAGPAGNTNYPSSSPYVISVGGTQTYLYTEPNGTQTAVQTAWSNRATVPNRNNAGGGGGGVSFLEPKPWYQQNQQTPASYPNGRQEPDLSLQAGLYPAIYIICAGTTTIGGGTSLSAPLLAGLLTLVSQSSGDRLGLINPFLYSLGNNNDLYTKAYNPVTFGYIIPWTASNGYNLATGWGAPNIGEIAHLYNTQTLQPTSLSVFVEARNANDEWILTATPDETFQVAAEIYSGETAVTTGSFTTKLETLAGTSLVTPMTYNPATQLWNCSLTLGNQSGIAFVVVNGSSNGVQGESFAEIFAGYLATFHSPTPVNPWTTAGTGITVTVTATDLDGNVAPAGPVSMQVSLYSILNNRYTQVDSITLAATNDPTLGEANTANLDESYPAGPMLLTLQGSTFGYLPFTNGIYLQTTTITPEVCAEPGCIAPGQYLSISTSPMAPLNVANIQSADTGTTLRTDVAAGSKLSAYLLTPAGVLVSTAELIFSSASSRITGLLQVPANATSGLYTVLLYASFGSSTLRENLRGEFYGQVWVSNGTITPQITLAPATIYMGQTTKIYVDIRYPNNQEVKLGQYTAIIYPKALQNQLTAIMGTKYINLDLIPLSFNASLNKWEGTIQMPSPYDAGAMKYIIEDSLNYAGLYDVYVTGLSYDGVPTTTARSAQKDFTIQPYTYIANQEVTTFQQNWNLALNEVTIKGTTNLASSVFLEANYLQEATSVISDSTIEGTLYITNSNLILRGVHGGTIVATNSSLNLVNSDLTSITLVDSVISQSASSYQTITPAAPTITIVSPLNGASYQNDLAATITVVGNNVNAVTVYLNNQPVRTFASNGTLNFNLPTANYPDGTYLMQIVATQTDGISSSTNLTMHFNSQNAATISGITSTQNSQQNQLNGLGNNLNTLNETQSTLQNQLNNMNGTVNDQLCNLNENLNSLNSTQTDTQNQLGEVENRVNEINATQPAVQASLDTLHNQIADLQTNLNAAQNLAYAGIAIGIIGVAITLTVVLKRRPKT